ncbi:GMC family oxidoreductase [Pseudoxanthomonas sp.]|uniref:GMC oxidoreductase n=1 Tax=Pseudoxanthomonas sp. TaxID=1871049 RepID=UPI00263708F0|nr:GMC family oxidoreductase [Pseudoxanthomonas sp.]WDS36916.1 MAG: GMC family oxidoreductase [Pseudoxanthomonas sp.]
MIVDYLEDSATAENAADICIVGAGAAGIAIARSFIGTSLRVCLLEGGGLTGELRSQALYRGQSVGAVPLDPATSRMRAFGGSCNLWGGGCMPLNPLDLCARDWVAHSGWPITATELEPYYLRALEVCGLPRRQIDGSGNGFDALPGLPPIPFDRDKLNNQIFMRTPLLFGRDYLAEIERAPNVTALLHANLLELNVTPDGRAIQGATIGSLSGKRSVVRARHFVLACGGIENARLLLLSDKVLPGGPGNSHGSVGRYFMDHPSGKLGAVVGGRTDQLARPYDRARARGTATFPEICLSEQAQQAHGLLNGRVHPFVEEGTVPRGLAALRGLRTGRRVAPPDEGSLLEAELCAAMRNSALPESRGATGTTTGLLLQLALGMGDVARALARKRAGKPAVRSSHLVLVGYFEQAPNPESRVRLDHEVDALGQRKICMDWRLNALDRHTYRNAARLFGQELARASGGRFEPEPWVAAGDETPPQVEGTGHHMGTTRMAEDARHGVVDRDCRVHGMDNLHIAGSSVFPTGGWAFPTFTIIALGLRLAERLQALCG